MCDGMACRCAGAGRQRGVGCCVVVAGAGEFCLCFVEVDRVQTTKTATAIKLAEKNVSFYYNIVLSTVSLPCHLVVGLVVFFAIRVYPLIYENRYLPYFL